MKTYRIMRETYKKYFVIAFQYVCAICAILLTCRCISNFSLDKDMTEINFREYHGTADDMYPSMTFCHQNPFILDELQKYNKNVTVKRYKQLLAGSFLDDVSMSVEDIGWISGENWTSSFMDIDYDEVTIEIKDFVARVSVIFLSNNFVQLDTVTYLMQNASLAPDTSVNKKEYLNLPKINYYTSTRHFLFKCFTFDVPFVPGRFMNSMEIDISASIFADNMVHPDTRSGNYFITYGYPNQLMRSNVRNRDMFIRPNFLTACFLQESLIGSVETLNRRNKRGQECNSDWKNHDKYTLMDIATKVGCNPKYWKIRLDLNNCTKQEEYTSIAEELSRLTTSKPPCKSIERMSKTTYENDLGNRCAFMNPFGPFGQLMVKVDFHLETMYKQIDLVQAYTLENLVGMAGNILSVLNFRISMRLNL